jgi:hypothetical protein
MGRYAGRFVVETHAHAQRAAVGFKERGIKPSHGQMYSEVSQTTWYDNSERLLFDMERYGVDLCVIMSGGLARGSDNDLDLKLAEKYPDKFVALCYPTTFLRRVAEGKEKWNVEGAVREVEERLKTGKYKGIGQELPVSETGAFGKLWATGEARKKEKKVSHDELLDRYRMFLDLASKYKVAVAGAPKDTSFLSPLAAEYPDVPLLVQLVGMGPDATTHQIQTYCEVIQRSKNIYLEMGTAPAELIEVALSDPNVGPTQITHGTDWGASHYIYSQPGRPIHGERFTTYVDFIPKWGAVRYQTDWWGWSLYQIDRLRNTLTQDEINLILGGNAARIFKLDVPYTRLFPEGRPDLWGVDVDKYSPFIPQEQIKKKQRS